MRFRILVLLLVAALAMMACEGPMGPQGEQGEAAPGTRLTKIGVLDSNGEAYWTLPPEAGGAGDLPVVSAYFSFSGDVWTLVATDVGYPLGQVTYMWSVNVLVRADGRLQLHLQDWGGVFAGLYYMFVVVY